MFHLKWLFIMYWLQFLPLTCVFVLSHTCFHSVRLNQVIFFLPVCLLSVWHMDSKPNPSNPDGLTELWLNQDVSRWQIREGMWIWKTILLKKINVGSVLGGKTSQDLSIKPKMWLANTANKEATQKWVAVRTNDNVWVLLHLGGLMEGKHQKWKESF